VNAIRHNHSNALTAAAQDSHEPIVHLPIGNSANVNAVSSHRGNGLTCAAFYGHDAIACLLIDNAPTLTPFIITTATLSLPQHIFAMMQPSTC
jgi:hypothetical protein